MAEHWGWLIAIYLFLGGLGAGAYLSSYAAEKGWLGSAASLKRTGYYISGPIVALGAGLLVFDLGQGLHKPWLLIGLLKNPHSVMTWGTAIISAFIMLGCLRGYLAWAGKKAPGWLGFLGAVFALATGAYTGLLLAVVKAVPLWNTYLMPVLFVISALSTGLSITSLLAHWLETGEIQEGRVCQTHLGLVGVEIVVLFIMFLTVVLGFGGQAAKDSVLLMLTGTLAGYFWILLVGAGLVVPFLLYARKTLSLRQEAAALGDVGPDVFEKTIPLSVKGHAIQERAILICDGAVVLGGFALRALIIFAALPVWDGMIRF